MAVLKVFQSNPTFELEDQVALQGGHNATFRFMILFVAIENRYATKTCVPFGVSFSPKTNSANLV